MKRPMVLALVPFLALALTLGASACTSGVEETVEDGEGAMKKSSKDSPHPILDDMSTSKTGTPKPEKKTLVWLKLKGPSGDSELMGTPTNCR